MKILDKLVRQLSRHSHEILLDRGEESMMPIYHLVTDTGQDLVIGCPWRNNHEKQIIIDEVKKIALEHGAVAVGFAGEMWMSQYPAGKLPEQIDPPSQDPKRIEGVLIVATDGTITKSKTWRIVRSKPGGPIINLVAMPMESAAPSDTMGGRIIDDILPKKTPPDEAP